MEEDTQINKQTQDKNKSIQRAQTFANYKIST